jgi:hypothetical protein
MLNFHVKSGTTNKGRGMESMSNQLGLHAERASDVGNSEVIASSIRMSNTLSAAEQEGIRVAIHKSHKSKHAIDLKNYRAKSKERTLLRKDERSHKLLHYGIVTKDTKPKGKNRTTLSHMNKIINKVHQIFRLFGSHYNFGMGDIEDYRNLTIGDLKVQYRSEIACIIIKNYEIVLSEARDELQWYYIMFCYFDVQGLTMDLHNEDEDLTPPLLKWCDEVSHSLNMWKEELDLIPDLDEKLDGETFHKPLNTMFSSDEYMRFLTFPHCKFMKEDVFSLIDSFLKLYHSSPSGCERYIYASFLHLVGRATAFADITTAIKYIKYTYNELQGHRKEIESKVSSTQLMSHISLAWRTAVDFLVLYIGILIKAFKTQREVSAYGKTYLGKVKLMKDKIMNRIRESGELISRNIVQKGTQFYKRIQQIIKELEKRFPFINEIFNWAEFVIVLYSLIYQPQTFQSAFILLYTYCRRYINRGDSAALSVLCAGFGTAILRFQAKNTKRSRKRNKKMNQGIDIHQEDFEETISEIGTGIDYVLTSSLSQSIIVFMTTLCAYQQFPKEVAKRIYSFVGKPPERLTIPRAIQAGLEMIAKLMKVFRLVVFEGVPLCDALFQGDPLTAAIARTQELMVWRDKLYDGLPVPGMKSQNSFYVEAGALLKLFEKLKETKRPGSTDFNTIHKYYLQLITVISEIDLKVSASNRITPLFIVIEGPPHIGKSTMINYVAYLMSSVMNVEYDPSLIYHRVISSDYWDGYNPISHPFIHYSELGTTHRNRAANQGDPATEELTSVVDSITYPVNVAFEGKGKVFCRPTMVVADTNTVGLNLDVLVNNAGAFKRRMLCIRPWPKQEYANQHGLLDAAKAEGGKNMMDMWTYDLYHYEPVNSKLANRVDDLKSADVHAFTDTLKDIMVKHLKRQTNMLDSRINENFERYGSEWKDRNIWGILDLFPDEKGNIDQEDQEFNDLIDAISEPVSDDELIRNRENVMGIINSPRTTWKEQMRDYIFLFLCSFLKCIHAHLLAYRYKLFFHMFQGHWFSIINIVFFLMFVRGWLTFANYVLLMIILWFTYDNFKSALMKEVRGMLFEDIRNNAHFAWQKVAEFFKKQRDYAPIWFDAISLLIAGLSTYVLVNSFRITSEENIEEAETHFPYDDASTRQINEVERKINAGSVLKRVKNEQLSVWNDVLSRPPNLHTGTMEELELKVMRNRFRVIAVKDSKASRTFILGLQGNYALVNTHFIRKYACPFELRLFQTEDDMKSFSSSMLSSKDIVDIGQDVSIVRLSARQFTNICKHFGSHQNWPTVARGRINYESVNCTIVPGIVVNENSTLTPAYQYNWDEHKVGMCGTPLIAEVGKGACIVGLHSAGARDSECPASFAGLINQQSIYQGLNKIKTNTSLIDIMDECEADFQYEDPIRKSSFYHLNLHNLQYYGKHLGNVTIDQKSRLTRTVFSRGQFLDVLFYEANGFIRTTVFERPLMMPKKVNGEYISPYNIGIEKINQRRLPLDRDVLNFVIGKIVDRVITGLKRDGITSVAPLTMHEAINGVPDDPFIRRMNASTSAGFGRPGKKRDYFIYTDENQTQAFANSLITEDFSKVLSSYDKGTSARLMRTVQLKDEARDQVKVEQGKTRLFYSASTAGVVASRQFIGPILSLMVSHPDLFCTAIGIDMHTEYHDLMRDLKEFSDIAMECDYSSFDQVMPYDIGWASASVTFRLAERLGYNEEALKYLRGVLTDNLFPHIEMNKDVFCAPGLKPSGDGYTAEDNSIRHLVMLMYAWYKNEATKHLDFFDYVKPRTYGDDLLAAIKRSISHIWNNKIYAQLCKEYYGITCTPAIKGDEFAEYLLLYSTQFLKRTAIFKKDLDRYVAVLDLNSLYKSLEWYTPSRAGLADWEQISGSLSSCLREMFFHLDAIPYAQFRETIVKRFKEAYPFVDDDYCCSNFLHYDELLQFYRDKIYGKNTFPSYIQQESSKEEDETKYEVGSESEGTEKSPKDPNLRCNIVRKPHLIERTSETHYMQLKKFLAVLKEEFKEASFELDKVPAPIPGLSNQALVKEDSYMTNPDFRKLVDAYIDAKEKVKSLQITIEMIESSLVTLSRIVQVESAEMTSGEVSSAVMDVHENVLDVVGQEDIKTDAGWATYNPTFTDTPMELNEFLSRPAEISKFTTAPGAYVAATLDPWSLYLNQPSVRAKLKNYAFLRATMNIKVVVSGTPFHALQAIVSYVPLPIANRVAEQYVNLGWTGSAYRNRRITWLSQATGCKVVQVRDNQPVHVSAPFVHVVPMISLWKRNQTTTLTAAQGYDSVDNLGKLVIESPAPLTDCASTPTDVSWYVYAYLSDVQLGCPTKTVVEIVTEADERDIGPVEAFATSAKQVADSLVSVPWLNPYAKASSIALGALTRISAFFGWSYPTMNSEPMRIKNEPYRNAANVVGYDLGQRITLDPKQELIVDPRVGGIAEDELSISSIAGRQSYFTNFTWTLSAASASPLFKMPIYPGLVNQEGLSTEFQQPTALAMTCEPFSYWRGKVAIRFDVICTQYHRGKLAFVFEPNVGQNVLIDSTGLTLNKQHVFVLDLQESQTIELCFDWAAARAWLSCGGYILWNGGVAANQEQFNGYVSVFPMTKLQSPDAGDIFVNVYVSGKEMHYNYFSSELPTLSWESEQIDDYTCITINPTGSSEDHIHDFHFGEGIASFRSLLKRFSLVSVPSSASDIAVGQCYQFQVPLYPALLPDRTNSTALEANLFSFLRTAFLGIRGGMRFRIAMRYLKLGIGSNVRILNDFVSNSFPSTTIVAAIPTNPQRGTVNFVPFTNGGIEFEVPFYTNLLFVAANEKCDIDSSAVPLEFNRSFTVQIDGEPNSTGPATKIECQIYTATAEDFTFIRFLGAPPVRF